MELLKNIFFNTDKLIENNIVKITYTGKLFQNGSEEVFLHYGFGNNWDNLNEVKMEKSDIGFQVEIELLSSDTLNLCFRNSNNEWDNNDSANYIFPIEKAELALVVKEKFNVSAPRKLRKTYLWSKKIRLAVYKIITYLPKIISGNYKRKIDNENN